MRAFKTYSFSNNQIYNIVLLTIVTVLCIPMTFFFLKCLKKPQLC